MKTELEKALSGESFSRRDAEVIAFQTNVKELLYDFNHARPSDPKRAEIVRELVTGYNQYVFIEDGFHCVFGKNVHFEGTAMINFNCTFLDSNIITIGHCALIGPNCNIICTNHTLDADERLRGGFYDKPVTIGAKTWLGANVTVLPGVTIGEGAVIGAGSVVTKDIPPYTVAVGNPCKVVKEIPHK
ncbi:MAG: sugar O-acetyltransferase [Clostridiales bacterium]|nr:sugar O-acetyltransferase [Clostridiales bacterium]